MGGVKILTALKILTPLRFPIVDQNRRTVERAGAIAREHHGELVVLHINLAEYGRQVSEDQLEDEIQEEVGGLDVGYLVREGEDLEGALIDEIERLEPDIVVMGERDESEWERDLARSTGEMDLDEYLRDRYDCEIEVVK